MSRLGRQMAIACGPVRYVPVIIVQWHEPGCWLPTVQVYEEAQLEAATARARHLRDEAGKERVRLYRTKQRRGGCMTVFVD